VIHTNGFKMHVLGAWARPRGSAVLWHVHDYVTRRALMAKLLRFSRHRCSAAVANSRSVADDVTALCGRDLTVHPVWNAVDLGRFAPDGPWVDLDALSGLPRRDDVVRVGLVATFARWKGHRTFLAALARVPASLRVRGYIIGGPVYATSGSQVTLDELKQDAAALGVADRVGFTGIVSDSSMAMRALDVVVHASTRPEPFGRTIAEAMAAGRPLVAAENAGAAELLRASGAALLFAPNDAAALARALERLAHSSRLRSNTGSLAIATARALFDSRRLGPAMTAIYAHLRPGAHGAASGTAACRSGDEASPRTPM
jgi:glycosyltransferase involved in cell wall biosynthesis